MPLERVQPADVDAIWPRIAAGLARCIEKCGPWDWTPDKVRARLMSQHAALYMRAEGFLVVEQRVHDLTGEKYLLVWIAAFEPMAGRRHMLDLVAFVDAVKLAHDCAWTEFISPRDGWAGLEPYFRPVATIWRRG